LGDKVNKKTVLIFIFAAALALSGCSEAEEDFDETTISVSKRGKVSERIVESFNKDYYDLAELEDEFTRSVMEYNAAMGSEEIRVKSIELKDSQVYVDVDFNGPSDYESFVGENLFVGTVSDAYDNGYSMDVTLKAVDSQDKIGKVQIMGMNDNTIIILSEHVRVKAFKDIAYVSANVDVINSKEVRVLSESDGLAYLILK